MTPIQLLAFVVFGLPALTALLSGVTGLISYAAFAIGGRSSGRLIAISVWMTSVASMAMKWFFLVTGLYLAAAFIWWLLDGGSIVIIVVDR